MCALTPEDHRPGPDYRYLIGAGACMLAGVAATWLFMGRHIKPTRTGPAPHETVLHAPPGEPTYRHPAWGFAFSPPSGWVPADPARQELGARLRGLPREVKTVAFDPTDRPSPVRHIHVVVQDARLPLDAIARDKLNEAAQRLEAAAGEHGMRACKVVGADAIYVNGLHGARIEYTADVVGLPSSPGQTPGSTTAVRVMHAHLKAPRRVYAITFSCEENAYADLREAFMRSLASFRVPAADGSGATTRPALPP